MRFRIMLVAAMSCAALALGLAVPASAAPAHPRVSSGAPVLSRSVPRYTPYNPPDNILPANGLWFPSCSWGDTPDNSAACTNSVLEDINYAHYREGIPFINLPGDWYSLTEPE